MRDVLLVSPDVWSALITIMAGLAILALLGLLAHR
jgi:hypothetical protein